MSDRVLEPRRLAAVLRAGLLQTEPEAVFDDLTRLAALVIGAPLAFATVVDEAISFWKSSFGLPLGSPRENAVEESFCKYVVRTEQELIVRDAELDDRTRENPSVQSMGVRAWLGFPLFAPHGEVLGSFCVVDLVPRDWTDHDIEVMRTLAAAASREIALREAIRSEYEARNRAEALIKTLQESLLPPTLPAVPGLDVAAVFHPAGTGEELLGDFYDLLASRDGGWTFVVGDICGKGVQAAKLAAFARHTIGSVAMRSSDPAAILVELNETLALRSPAPDTFLTAICGTIVFRDGRHEVRLARAGHPAPILRHRNGSVEFLEPTGQLIGVLNDVLLTEMQLVMAPGDTLVLYTDGVDEARLGRGAPTFGSDALAKLIASFSPSMRAADLVDAIASEVIAFSGGITSDDIALLALRVPTE